MLKTLKNALKVKDIRDRLLFTFFMLIIVRLGSQLPVPGVNSEYFAEIVSTDTFNFFNSITGGSFESFSIFALSITPYITSSIIMQLLTVAIPKLEEMQKEEDGRRKIAEITRYVTVGLALIQSIALAVGFGGQGLLVNFTWYNVCVVVVALTAGSAFLMWIGEQITDRGIGNGISVVLLINILSGMPGDMAVLFERFVTSASNIGFAVLAVIVIVAVIVAIIAFVVLLNDAIRKIPVQYSQKVVGRRSVGGQSSHIPLKVNTAGVIPVIFASSIMTFPVIIAQFFTVDYSTWYGQILQGLTSSNWCNPDNWIYSIGLLVYIVLIVAFAYFYTSITFNPLEIATNMKKNGGFIPGIRPGKNTSDYLNKVLNHIVFIGAVGLTIVAVIPIVISGVFGISSLSFGGTSIIIVVSVIIETVKQIESKMLVRNYKGFLND